MVNKSFNELLSCLDGEERRKVFNKLESAKECLMKLNDEELFQMFYRESIRSARNKELNKSITELIDLIQDYEDGNWFY